MPPRSIRRHSRYMLSAVRDAAIRSGTWSAAPHTSHHARISESDSDVLAFSILLHLDSCHPAARASSRLVSPASSRISRRRSAIAWRAAWALEDEETGGTSPSLG